MSKKKPEPLLDNDFDIKHSESIVAINILREVYKIDICSWTDKEIQNIIKLMKTALDNPRINKE